MKASELKSGMVIQVDNRTVYINGVQVQTASSRSGNTLYKVRGRAVATGQKFAASFKGDEVLSEVAFERRPVQLLYRDADGCTFMDSETYEQHTLSDEALSDELPYLSDGLEGLHALIVDGRLLGIQLPPTVVMEVIDTSPAIKGATAAARNKPATLPTGLVVQVPEYLATGERIKINTTTGEFMSRA